MHCPGCHPLPPSQGACFPPPPQHLLLEFWELTTPGGRNRDWNQDRTGTGCVLLLCHPLSHLVCGLRPTTPPSALHPPPAESPGLEGGSGREIVGKLRCQLKINIINNYFLTFFLTHMQIYLCSLFRKSSFKAFFIIKIYLFIYLFILLVLLQSPHPHPFVCLHPVLHWPLPHCIFFIFTYD